MKFIPYKIIEAGASGLLNIISSVQGFIQSPHGRTIRIVINTPKGEFKTYRKMPKDKVNTGGIEEMNYMDKTLDKIKNIFEQKNSYAHVRVHYRSISISG